jgi:hypothetical protein
MGEFWGLCTGCGRDIHGAAIYCHGCSPSCHSQRRKGYHGLSETKDRPALTLLGGRVADVATEPDEDDYSEEYHPRRLQPDLLGMEGVI